MTNFITAYHVAYKICVFCILALLLAGKIEAYSDPTEYKKQWAQNFIQDIKHDFSNYMENDNLMLLGDTFLVAGILANTGLDRAVSHHWKKDFHSTSLTRFFKFPETVGCLSFYYAPIYLGTMALGHLRENSLPGNVLYHWGYRSFRTFIIGGAQQALLTNILGSGRPNRDEDSKWQPLKHQTGVSGHAFYGAIPFLSAAMMTDPLILKYGLYVFSALPGLSRINSQRHYLSQVIMGWSLAFLSARSVYQSDMERVPKYQVGLYPRADGAMLAARLQF